MKSVKNTFSFFVPLTLMLISFSIYLISTNIVSNYKSDILNDYSIVVVSNLPLDKAKYKSLADIDVEKIETLERENIIQSMKNSLSSNSIDLLKQKLPYFYKIYLELFPSTDELKEIKATLLKDKNIKTVETFSKNHNQVYELLILIENMSIVLFLLILIFAILTISKQIKLWFYIHVDKILIMKLHGASTIYSASPIIKYSIVASLLAFSVSAMFFIVVVTNLSKILPYNLENLTLTINVQYAFVELFLLSFVISLSTIFGILINYSLKQK